VVAPSLILSRPGDRMKSNRRGNRLGNLLACYEPAGGRCSSPRARQPRDEPAVRR
jgi:hypothetical protein